MIFVYLLQDTTCGSALLTNDTIIVKMLSFRYSLSHLLDVLLIKFVACDTCLVTGIEYYITSEINPKFYSNLVAYGDGSSNWPGVGKDEAGSPAYGKWVLTSTPNSNSYQLENGVRRVLDITGGTSSAQANPRLFLNDLKNKDFDGQAGWVFIKAKETNLPNQDNGFWCAIVNQNWNLALRLRRCSWGLYLLHLMWVAIGFLRASQGRRCGKRKPSRR